VLTLLLSPTEHALQTLLNDSRNIPWSISSKPEDHGCDVLSITRVGVIGFQRKTLADLHSSLLDGRLYKELAQLNASQLLAHKYLIIESTFRQTVTGDYVDAPISKATVRNIINKFHAHNIGYQPTDSPDDTLTCITTTSTYLSSTQVTNISRPKQISDSWGQSSSSSYAVFLLQSFPGIGPTTAKAIYDHFGYAPINWTCTVEDLTSIPGIGRKTAEKLISALSQRHLPNR
jgi:ERCC4-type nuclease